MRELLRPVTLTFRSSALERAYRRDVSLRIRRTYRWLSILSVVGIAGAWFADHRTFGTAANTEVIHQVRLFVMFPVLLAGTAFGFVREAWFCRGWPAFVVSGLLGLLVPPTVAAWLMPDRAAIDIVASFIAIIAVMVSGAIVAPIGMAYVVLFLVGAGVPLLVLANAFGDLVGDAPGWLVFAMGVATFGAFQINLRDRLAFAAGYQLEQERARSEELLHNVLPVPIASRLKAGEGRIADHFEEATVLFADLVGFTPLAQKLSPTDLVDALDEVFSAFDDIAARHGLEKIKTIGDAYMVVGGVPSPREDHAAAVAAMAIEMRDLLANRTFGEGVRLELRVGMHCGPVVAGVIGKQKFIYDLWGDTVNVASRMESSGVVGEIQVTEAVAHRLRSHYELASRGRVPVKGKGELETFLLRPAA